MNSSCAATRTLGIPSSDVDDAVSTLEIWLPKGAMKVTGGELRGDTAVLEVEADLFPGQKGLTLVQMVKSGAKWQFERATRPGRGQAPSATCRG